MFSDIFVSKSCTIWHWIFLDYLFKKAILVKEDKIEQLKKK